MKTLVTFLVLITLVQFSHAQWVEQNSGTNQALLTVSAVDNNVCWAGGEGQTVLKTTDGGTTWNLVMSYYADFIIVDLHAFSLTSAYLLDLNNLSNETYISKTTNGGVNWTSTYFSSSLISSIFFISTDSGVVVGKNPNSSKIIIWKTTNGGALWDSAGMTFSASTYGVPSYRSLFMLGQEIWFYTDNKKVFYSSNFGNNWIIQQLDPINQTYSGNIWFNSSTLGMASCTTVPSATTNGGLNWISQASPIGTGSKIGGLIGFGNKFWCGYGTNINLTTNNGAAWTVVYTAPIAAFNDLSLARNGVSAWGVRNAGKICKNSNLTGITPISGNVPSSFSLLQNYPNPFNPSTRIRYNISKASFVKLAVYDILGQEVSSLVNEQLKPGEYEAEWYAGNTPSGVYFYKLTADGYTETKKMMLVK